jgi:toluene monooxygenase system ferredoxin subunit
VRAASGFVRVLASGELPACEGLESEILCVEVGDQMVLVGRLEGGTVVAFEALCPHERTDLRNATFVEGRVRCPRHNYLYDAHSGENVIPTEVARPENLWKLRPGYLATYQAEEHDGWVWVSERPNPAPDSWDPIREQRPPGWVDRANIAIEAPEPEPEAPAGPIEHPEVRLEVTRGAEFVVCLPTFPKPAYMWRVDLPTGILVVVKQSFDPTANPPQYQVCLRANEAGEGALRCLYRTPWDAEPAEIRTYVVHVRAD